MYTITVRKNYFLLKTPTALTFNILLYRIEAHRYLSGI